MVNSSDADFNGSVEEESEALEHSKTMEIMKGTGDVSTEGR